MQINGKEEERLGLREEKGLLFGPLSLFILVSPHALHACPQSSVAQKKYKRLFTDQVLGLFFFLSGQGKIFRDLSNPQDLFMLLSVHTPVKKTAYSNFIHSIFQLKFKDLKWQCTLYRNVHHHIITVEFNVNAAVEICESHSSTMLF